MKPNRTSGAREKVRQVPPMCLEEVSSQDGFKNQKGSTWFIQDICWDILDMIRTEQRQEARSKRYEGRL